MSLTTKQKISRIRDEINSLGFAIMCDITDDGRRLEARAYKTLNDVEYTTPRFVAERNDESLVDLWNQILINIKTFNKEHPCH